MRIKRLINSNSKIKLNLRPSCAKTENLSNQMITKCYMKKKFLFNNNRLIQAQKNYQGYL